MTRPRRLRRVELSTPASSERMIQRAAWSDADLCFLDLEDAVAPAEKPAARERAARALVELDWGATARAVRINAVDSEWFADDLEQVVGEAGLHLDVVVVPKVMGAADVHEVERRLERLERTLGRTEPIGIEVLIEEAESLVRVAEIATSSARLEALIFGSGDFAASLGMRGSRLGELRGDPWGHARHAILVAARAAGIDAVDGPYWGPTRDLEGYRAECTELSILGFAGKWAIHPDQVPVAAEAFGPSVAEVDRARRVRAAFAAAHAAGLGAIEIDGQMADLVDLRLADAILAEVERIGARNGSRA
jgi:citrate lyase subunit beta / citryl-CoA lyase